MESVAVIRPFWTFVSIGDSFLIKWVRPLNSTIRGHNFFTPHGGLLFTKLYPESLDLILPISAEFLVFRPDTLKKLNSFSSVLLCFFSFYFIFLLNIFYSSIRHKQKTSKHSVFLLPLVPDNQQYWSNS